MARALYYEADVTVLDDPFSALDSETSALVRRRLFAEGHATADGRTLIMSTSMREHLMDAHAILHVSDEGSLSQVSLEEAVAHPEDFVRDVSSQEKSKAEHGAGSEEPPAVAGADEKAKPITEASNVQRGDLSLYKYYLRPAGVLRVVIYLLLTAYGSVSENMPCKSCKLLFILAICTNYTDIYARIWHERDPASKIYYIGFAFMCMNYPFAIASGAL